MLIGETFDDAAAAALDDVRRTGATLVPPFDEPMVMAGQGTAVAEALQQIRDDIGGDVDTVVLPVGGGGLLGGSLALTPREPLGTRVRLLFCPEFLRQPTPEAVS